MRVNTGFRPSRCESALCNASATLWLVAVGAFKSRDAALMGTRCMAACHDCATRLFAQGGNGIIVSLGITTNEVIA